MPENYNTRETLLLKLKNSHDDKAWQEFNNIYQGFIWSILIKMQIPKADQGDLVQDVLIKSWKALPDFDYDSGRGKFRSWLSLVTSNAARSYFRIHNRHSALFINEDSDQKVEAEIEKISLAEWKKFIAEKAWANVSPQLNETLRQCFELISQGVDMHEIGEQLAIPYNTVCVYKKRVINKIAKEIAELEEQLG